MRFTRTKEFRVMVQRAHMVSKATNFGTDLWSIFEKAIFKGQSRRFLQFLLIIAIRVT